MLKLVHLNYSQGGLDDMFTVILNLHFKPEVTPRGFKMFQKKTKLPQLGVELTTLLF